MNLHLIQSIVLNVIVGTFIGKLSGLIIKDRTNNDEETTRNLTIIKVIVSLIVIVSMYHLYVRIVNSFNFKLHKDSNLIMAWVIFNANIHIAKIFKDLIKDIPPRL
jgi:hypothetical protein